MGRNALFALVENVAARGGAPLSEQAARTALEHAPPSVLADLLIHRRLAGRDELTALDRLWGMEGRSAENHQDRVAESDRTSVQVQAAIARFGGRWAVALAGHAASRVVLEALAREACSIGAEARLPLLVALVGATQVRDHEAITAALSCDAAVLAITETVSSTSLPVADRGTLASMWGVFAPEAANACLADAELELLAPVAARAGLTWFSPALRQRLLALLLEDVATWQARGERNAGLPLLRVWDRLTDAEHDLLREGAAGLGSLPPLTERSLRAAFFTQADTQRAQDVDYWAHLPVDRLDADLERLAVTLSREAAVAIVNRPDVPTATAVAVATSHHHTWQGWLTCRQFDPAFAAELIVSRPGWAREPVGSEVLLGAIARLAAPGNDPARRRTGLDSVSEAAGATLTRADLLSLPWFALQEYADHDETASRLLEDVAVEILDCPTRTAVLVAVLDNAAAQRMPAREVLATVQAAVRH